MGMVKKVGGHFYLAEGKVSEEAIFGSERRSEGATGCDIGSITRIHKPKVHRLAESNCSLRTNKEKTVCAHTKLKRHVYKCWKCSTQGGL